MTCCLSVSSSYPHIDCYYHSERSGINRQLTGKRSKEQTETSCSLCTYRSNEKYGPMRGGGKCQCEDCGFPLKNARVLQKCTKSPPCSCSECHIAFKAKGKGRIIKKNYTRIFLCFPSVDFSLLLVYVQGTSPNT